MENTDHLIIQKENEGVMDFYTLAPGINISINQLHTSTWPKGDSSIFSDRMLVLNFCIKGRCDASLDQNQYAIVSEGHVCVSTILPVRDFYYPGRLYEGIQIYLDRSILEQTEGTDFLSQMGICVEQIVELFCKKNGLYLHQMSTVLCELTDQIWNQKDDVSIGNLRYFTVRLLHELMDMPHESESDAYFTRSQIAIVKEAEALIMSDLSRRISARKMAERFGISESSFKLYVKGILGDSYLSYFRKKRMERAAELLATTNLKIIEVSNAVGYENQGKFARAFADAYGVTPLEYRRSLLTKPSAGIIMT